MKRILVIQGGFEPGAALRAALEAEGFAVEVARDGWTGLMHARAGGVDLVVLDLVLPGLDGYQVLAAMREEGSALPVLVLTALADESDKVRAFRMGADDYVTRPFGVRELLARAHALLRRSTWGAPPPFAEAAGATMRFGSVEVRPATNGVFRDGRPVSLRPREFALLMALARRRGRLASQRELLHEVWRGRSSRHSIHTHVCELRRKLEDDPARPRYLLTVHSRGYRLCLDESAPPAAPPLLMAEHRIGA